MAVAILQLAEDVRWRAGKQGTCSVQATMHLPPLLPGSLSPLPLILQHLITPLKSESVQ
jgi:hypothetical protein